MNFNKMPLIDWDQLTEDIYAGFDAAGNAVGRLAELILMVVTFPIWFPFMLIGRYRRK